MAFFKKEKTIFERFSEHAAKALEAVELTDKAVDNYFKEDDLAEITRKIFSVETEADTISQGIARELFRGQLLPYTSEDWLELLDHVDDMADNCDRIAKFLLLYNVSVKKGLKKKIDSLMAHSLQAARVVRDSIELMRTDMEAAAKKVERVAKIRHEARDVEYDIFKKLFNSEIEVRQLILLKELAYWIAQVSNSAKRVAKRVMMMAVKYSF